MVDTRRVGGLGRLVALLSVLTMTLGPVAAASAQPFFSTPRESLPTEIVMTGTGAGQRVSGRIAPVGDTTFDPTAGYPAAPPANFEKIDLGFAGIITARPAAGGNTINTYCIDVRTPTRPGLGYKPGEWDNAQVPLVGYVAQILNVYYPNSNLPAAASDNLRAAAVQSAIWFFSDKYVLNPTDAAYPLTKSIVDNVIALGPVAAPTPPSLQIQSPETTSETIGNLIGPFVVTTTSPATLAVTGGQMFSDPAGTVPITNPVANNTQVWVRSDAVGQVRLTATAQATVPSGNVYLYDGKTSGTVAAQKLILAQTTVLTATAAATAQYYDTGILVVEKAITGNGAGLQSDIVIGVVCNDIAQPDFTIPAGSNPGSYQGRYGPLRTPATCVITEKSGGGNAVVTGAGSGGVTVELPENSIPGDESIGSITNTFTQNPGSLVVTKTIGGPGADLRGDIVIDVSCTDGTVAQFTIPAGQAPAPSYTVSPITAGAACTITETETGGNASTSSEVTIAPEGPVVIPPGGAPSVAITNTYTLPPGAILVTKAITGPGAASRSDIVIDVVCSNGTTEQITIPAGQEPAAEGYLVDGLPAGTTCEVTESATGGNAQVSATVGGLPESPVAIPPGGSTTVPITNDFQLLPGSLLVTKTIAGPANAQALRDQVVIDVTCSNGETQQIVIPAGQAPDPAGYLIEGLPAQTVCTIVESVDGSTTEVASEVVISSDEVTIPAGGQGTSQITDTYSLNPASLKITKGIGGREDLRGDVELQVTCSDGSQLTISIPAGADPDPAGYVLAGIAGDATCTVTETINGANEQATVVVEGLVTDLQLNPGGETVVGVTNDYQAVPGGLVVTKTLSGAGLELRGDVTIVISCTAPAGTEPLFTDTWVIPATETEVPVRNYEVPADSVCTVVETVDGSNGQTSVTTTYTVNGGLVEGPATGTVLPGGTTSVEVTNGYDIQPGSLTVSKTIAGEGAGQQGEIVIDVLCKTPDGSTLKPQEVAAQLVIPAGATSVEPLVLPQVPAGLVCTITETVDGSTASVTVVTVPAGPLEIEPGAPAVAEILNTYTPEVPVSPEVPEVPVTPETGAGSPWTTTILGLLLLAVGGVMMRGARLGSR